MGFERHVLYGAMQCVCIAEVHGPNLFQRSSTVCLMGGKNDVMGLMPILFGTSTYPLHAPACAHPSLQYEPFTEETALSTACAHGIWSVRIGWI